MIVLTLPFICYTFQVNSIDPIGADHSLICFEYTLIVVKAINRVEKSVRKRFYGTIFVENSNRDYAAGTYIDDFFSQLLLHFIHFDVRIMLNRNNDGMNSEGDDDTVTQFATVLDGNLCFGVRAQPGHRSISPLLSKFSV